MVVEWPEQERHTGLTLVDMYSGGGWSSFERMCGGRSPKSSWIAIGVVLRRRGERRRSWPLRGGLGSEPASTHRNVHHCAVPPSQRLLSDYEFVAFEGSSVYTQANVFWDTLPVPLNKSRAVCMAFFGLATEGWCAAQVFQNLHVRCDGATYGRHILVKKKLFENLEN